MFQLNLKSAIFAVVLILGSQLTSVYGIESTVSTGNYRLDHYLNVLDDFVSEGQWEALDEGLRFLEQSEFIDDVHVARYRNIKRKAVTQKRDLLSHFEGEQAVTESYTLAGLKGISDRNVLLDLQTTVPAPFRDSKRLIQGHYSSELEKGGYISYADWIAFDQKQFSLDVDGLLFTEDSDQSFQRVLLSYDSGVYFQDQTRFVNSFSLLSQFSSGSSNSYYQFGYDGVKRNENRDPFRLDFSYRMGADQQNRFGRYGVYWKPENNHFFSYDQSLSTQFQLLMYPTYDVGNSMYFNVTQQLIKGRKKITNGFSYHSLPNNTENSSFLIHSNIRFPEKKLFRRTQLLSHYRIYPDSSRDYFLLKGVHERPLYIYGNLYLANKLGATAIVAADDDFTRQELFYGLVRHSFSSESWFRTLEGKVTKAFQEGDVSPGFWKFSFIETSPVLTFKDLRFLRDSEFHYAVFDDAVASGEGFYQANLRFRTLPQDISFGQFYYSLSFSTLDYLKADVSEEEAFWIWVTLHGQL